jgi:3D (Asp-Asp-Asp) domain-containing protein
MKSFKILIGFLIVFICIILFFEIAYADTSYTVGKSDTLTGIAKNYYHDASQWKIIYDANKDVIKKPGLICPGWVLILPDKKEKTDAKNNRGSKNEPISAIATAYDLSLTSCGKPPDHPEYGITSSGRSVEGKSRLEAKCVAVDPKVIHMGSLLYLEFVDPEYYQYNGIYQGLDTGGGVKGNRIDVFMGDFKSTKASKEAKRFGRTKVKITILRDGW